MSIRSCAALLMILGLVPAVDASEKLVLKTYPVADLVIPIEGAPACSLAEGCSKKSSSPIPETLIKVVTNAIQPKSWAQNGGSGTVDYYPLGMALVVAQSPQVHDELLKLFESLRKVQDVQICFDVHLVQVSEIFATNDSSVVDNSQKRDVQDLVRQAKDKPALLTEKQFTVFLEAIQGDRRTNVLAAPKLTTLNGHHGSIQVSQSQAFVTGVSVEQINGQTVFTPKNETFDTGSRIDVWGVAAADRKSVYMQVKADVSEQIGEVKLIPIVVPITPVFEGGAQGKPVPFTQFIQHPNIQRVSIDKAATIPHNGTMLIVLGKTTAEEQNETAPPVLSKIPYINRFFKNVGTSKESYLTLLLVTPRVIVTAEEEEKQAGCLGSAIGAVSVSSNCGKGALIGGVGSDCCKTAECVRTCTASTQSKAGPMNLADVVALSTSGISDDIIRLQIETTGARFTLATEDILFLKKNKVSDAVVVTMQMSRVRNLPEPLPPSPYYQGSPPAIPQAYPALPQGNIAPSPLSICPLPPAQYFPAPGTFVRPISGELLSSSPTGRSEAAQEIGEFLIDSAIDLIEGIGDLLLSDSDYEVDLKSAPPISPPASVKMPKLLDLPDSSPRR